MGGWPNFLGGNAPVFSMYFFQFKQLINQFHKHIKVFYSFLPMPHPCSPSLSSVLMCWSWYDCKGNMGRNRASRLISYFCWSEDARASHCIVRAVQILVLVNPLGKGHLCCSFVTTSLPRPIQTFMLGCQYLYGCVKTVWLKTGLSTSLPVPVRIEMFWLHTMLWRK